MVEIKIHANPNPESSTDNHRKAVEALISSMSDESRSHVSSSIQPLDKKYIHDKDLLKKFSYLVATRDLEINSERTRHLQRYIDAMIEGESVEKSRVIIMNKGKYPEAFALPDGTIFLNQALINELDTLDEIGGVLGHEVGHIIDRTFERKSLGKEFEKFGVCWAHEIGSDVQAPRLAEKAGLKSTGLASAIQKISHNERGEIHQSGDMRAAQGMAVHMGLHYATSDQQETPIPKDWKSERVRPTNLQIAHEVLEEDDVDKENLPKLFAHLYGKDLASIKNILEERDRLDAFHHEIRKRLNEEGFNDIESAHFLISSLKHQYDYYSKVDARIIHTPDELVELTRALPTLEGSSKMQAMHNKVFDEIYEGSPTVDFVKYLSRNLFADDGDTIRGGVPVTQESLIEVLVEINNRRLFNQDEDDNQRAVEEAVYEYVKSAYIDPAEQQGTSLDTDGLRDFFEQVHSSALPLTEKGYRDMNIGIYNFSEQRKDLMRQVKDVLDDVLGIEGIEARVDTFFDQLEKRTISGVEAADLIETFFEDTRKYFQDNDIDDAQREQHVLTIIGRFGQHRDRSTDSLAHFLKGERSPLYFFEEERNEAVSRFNLQILAAVNLYDDSGVEFIRAVTDIMNNSEIDLQDLSDIQILNLCAPLLNQDPGSPKEADVYGFSSISRITFGFEERISYEDILQLPFIQEVSQRIERADIPTNIQELLRETTEAINTLEPFYESDVKDIFSDSPVSLIYFQKFRKAFSTIVKEGVEGEDKQYLYKFIHKFLPKDPTTTSVLRNIAKEELHSHSSLEEKIRFLEQHFEMLGTEGLTALGEEITTMEEYAMLRSVMSGKIDEYLHPKKETAIAAAGDFVSSFFTEKFDKLLETSSSDSKVQRETSTSLANEWIAKATTGYMTSYNVKTKSIVPDDYADVKPLIRSVKDIVDSLHDLPNSQRTALVMKALVDVDGGLTTPENREKLGRLTVDALRLRDRFINHVLPAACEVADPKVVGYPLGVLFSPLLFRSLDMEKIDIAKVMEAQEERRNEWKEEFGKDWEKYNLSEEDIRHLLSSPTREIVEFGSQYEDMEPNGSDSLPYKLAQKSKDLFYDVYEQLEKMVPDSKEDEETKDLQIDSGTESIIRAVQASGAVGVRALQLARQLLEFSPQVDSRLSDAFDSNPGLSKLLMWENLYKFNEKATTDERYADVGQFVDERLLSVGEKLGGGSLYTTYAAKVRSEDGTERESVVKILNPNAALVIRSFHTLAVDTLEKVKATGDPQDIRDADKALMLVEMAQQWCLADINDPSFEEDDDKFRQIIEGFNNHTGKPVVSAPERIFTGYLLKSEELAPGKTLNAVLNDDTIPIEHRQDAVREVLEFFDYQVSHPVSSQGKEKEYLVQSDPNPGNFIFQMSDEGLKMSVIDRNMFLHLNESEARAIKDLWKGNKEAFFRGFIGSIFDHNKVRNPLRKLNVGRDITNTIQEEIASVGGEEYVDLLHLMHKVMERLSAQKLEVPLHMHLAIKNALALKELKRRYEIETA